MDRAREERLVASQHFIRGKTPGSAEHPRVVNNVIASREREAGASECFLINTHVMQGVVCVCEISPLMWICASSPALQAALHI